MSASTASLTLMAVCAHPDDESTSVGGVLARYAREGVRTVVVTCTNGEFGDAIGGAKPGESGHDSTVVATTRLAELATACRFLGVEQLEVLGYRDSGMYEPSDRDLSSFCAVPVEVAAERVAALLETYRPQVVVTHDVTPGLQHPDHVHAGRVTTRAVKDTGVSAKLYFKAHGSSHWRRLREALTHVGIERPAPDGDQLRLLERIDRQITTTIDVTQVADVKRAALMAHASQLASSLAAKIPAELWTGVFGTESFIRAYDTSRARTPEDDLFAQWPCT